MPKETSTTVAIAWCLAWGGGQEPQFPLPVLQQMRDGIKAGKDEDIPADVKQFVQQARKLQSIKEDYFADNIVKLQKDYGDLWEQETRIGLVYGGATKIKQYVFEATKLPDIRGASGLLDRINLVDLPAFFHGETDTRFPQCQGAKQYCESLRKNWLDVKSPQLSDALIPELIIYSTGGNILAFCPAGFVEDLAIAVELRYTEETLTANSCAVGDSFRLLEIRFGLLQDPIEKTFWWDKYSKNQHNELVKAYFAQPDVSPRDAFLNRKSFNELALKLAAKFNQRRNGNDLPGTKTTRRYPPIFETHPYLMRDGSERRSAIFQAEELPGEPWFSEALIRKRLVSEKAKEESRTLPSWYRQSGLTWSPGAVESWVRKFQRYLYENPHQYYMEVGKKFIDEAKSVREIANASTPEGFVGYIYADGNNMGGYIQKIKTPQEYEQFSQDVFEATEYSVYKALAKHLKPHQLKNLKDKDNRDRNGTWIHPFEIITIGGDDVMLIVPADKALAIAQTIGEEFERRLMVADQKRYGSDKKYDPKKVHRYQVDLPSGSGQCKLSMSVGVLLAAEDTPIYYAERLTSELLKSAKKRVKDLNKDNYVGGTVDFLVMKSVTMVSSNIGEFRKEGLTQTRGNTTLKLYGAPYTLHELGGLLTTAIALKESEFPRSQIYQTRSFLEQGKRTAILNYLYFRTRLKKKEQRELLEKYFESAWCLPKDNNNKGNLAPWMTLKESEKTTYETIWRELVDLYPFIPEDAPKILAESKTKVNP